jgi:hypothetical protein
MLRPVLNIHGREPLTKENIEERLASIGKVLDEQAVPTKERLFWNPSTGELTRIR